MRPGDIVCTSWLGHLHPVSSVAKIFQANRPQQICQPAQLVLLLSMCFNREKKWFQPTAYDKNSSKLVPLMPQTGRKNCYSLWRMLKIAQNRDPKAPNWVGKARHWQHCLFPVLNGLLYKSLDGSSQMDIRITYMCHLCIIQIITRLMMMNYDFNKLLIISLFSEYRINIIRFRFL